MTDIKKINELLRFSHPVKVSLKFSDFDIKNFKLQDYLVDSDPYLISNNNSLKVILRYPFFISANGQSTLIKSEIEFRELGLTDELNIQYLEINEFQVLEVFFDNNFVIFSFPNLYAGWAIFKDGKELVQHHGYSEGIE